MSWGARSCGPDTKKPGPLRRSFLVERRPPPPLVSADIVGRATATSVPREFPGQQCRATNITFLAVRICRGFPCLKLPLFSTSLFSGYILCVRRSFHLHPRVSKPTHHMRSLYIKSALLAPLLCALRPGVHDRGMAQRRGLCGDPGRGRGPDPQRATLLNARYGVSDLRPDPCMAAQSTACPGLESVLLSGTPATNARAAGAQFGSPR